MRGRNITIDGVLSNGDDVSRGVTIINLEVWFKQSELLNPPPSIHNLNTILLSRVSLRSLWTWSSTKSLSRVRATKDAVRKSIEQSIDIGLREITGYGLSNDGSGRRRSYDGCGESEVLKIYIFSHMQNVALQEGIANICFVKHIVAWLPSRFADGESTW